MKDNAIAIPPSLGMGVLCKSLALGLETIRYIKETLRAKAVSKNEIIRVDMNATAYNIANLKLTLKYAEFYALFRVIQRFFQGCYSLNITT